MLQLWSALWRWRRRGAGRRGRGGKNSTTHWWWGQALRFRLIKPCSTSDGILSFIFILCFAAGVEREHQGSLQGATSSPLWLRPVLHLWIMVGQHTIHHLKYHLIKRKLKIIQFYAFVHQACVIRRSGLCNQWCEFHRLVEFILFYRF